MTSDQIQQLQDLAAGSATSNTHPANLATAVTALAVAVLELARLAWPDQVGANDGAAPVATVAAGTVVIDNTNVGVELAGTAVGNGATVVDLGNATLAGGAATVDTGSDASSSASASTQPASDAAAVSTSTGAASGTASGASSSAPATATGDQADAMIRERMDKFFAALDPKALAVLTAFLDTLTDAQVANACALGESLTDSQAVALAGALAALEEAKAS
jgi:hypothetical protein